LTRGLAILIKVGLGAIVLVMAVQYHMYRRLEAIDQGLQEMRSLQPQSGRARASERLPVEPIAVDFSTARGKREARVALLEFSDFQCPYCIKFAQGILPEIDRTFLASGDVLLVFRHLPLDIHPLARKAAAAAECAGQQGHFWAMHDRLIQDDVELAGGKFNLSVQLIGLDVSRFDGCLNGPPSSRIQKDIDEARALGITSTPTFLAGELVNGHVKVRRRIAGAQPFPVFERVLRDLISSTQQAR
jgi:protein-disulfide isomerase